MAWLLLFFMPYLLMQGQDQDQVLSRVLIHSWIPLCFYALIFYLNYLYFIDRFLFNRQTVLFLLINLSLIAICVWINQELKDYLSEVLVNRNRNNRPPRTLFFYLDIIASTVPLAFAIALKTTERWMKTEVERKEAQHVKLQSEIQHLKYQLQPHFFFNSLNTIYAMVDSAPEKAKENIHNLGKLMRYLLYDTETEKVPLQKEIDFMKKYIELMKHRFSDKIQISYTFPETSYNFEVVPLLFITLVENAFKHGIPASKSATLSFTMEIKDSSLVFRAVNPDLPKNKEDKSGSGIGLENLKKRLELLYPNRHSLTYGVENDIFSAVLTLET
ncbi:MAG: histidine kinase [Muriicola sp.]|nr:histidine kinase [Muriicola sp.]MBT8282508.1 histidine kinase [Muriicola sp.]NNK11521.1 histidine kinase [Flavobacteriaceae bacterium]